MKKLFFILISAFLPLSFFLVGCSNEQTTTTKKDDNIISVYTTVYPLQYFTERIGGSFVEVNTVYPPGSDEHTYEPTQKDMMKLVNADIFFYIGLGLEGFVNKATETLKKENVTLLAVGEHVHFEESHEVEQSDHDATHEEEEEHSNHDATHEEEEEHSDHEEDGNHDHEGIDPHVWLDPLYADDLAEAIKDALVKEMPEQKETFEQNYQELSLELQTLHENFESIVHSAKRNEIIVSHAAYGYWEERYGIEQISISGLSTTSEPSQKKLEEIVVQAKKFQIKYILFEQNVSSKLAEIIKKEVGAEPLSIHNLSVLTEDDIKNDENYFTVMEQNIETLKKALNE